MTPYRPNILVADNDEATRRDLSAFFSRKGWDCNVVCDVEQFGRELSAEAEYDLVIADPDLPGLDLMALVMDVFRRKPSQALIVVGSSPQSDQEMRLIHNGITDVITKPVDFSLIERCIEQAVRLRGQDERERSSARFIASERTEMQFTCQQLAELQAVALPILERLVEADLLTSYDGLKIRLAIQEGILNAMEHGNLELDSRWKEEYEPDGSDKFSRVRRERLADPNYRDRTVHFVSVFDGEVLEITIKDEGDGFLASERFVQDIGENLSCFGRGMTLMNDAVDEIRYTDGGSQVTLIKILRKPEVD
jgi:DNA-binding response OmpR family regulator